jgi:sulfide:quinone oxidoreductase
MQVLRINPLISVADQISEADVAAIAARGFRTVIGNRPDSEGGTPVAAISAACERAGLRFAFQPVVYTRLSIADGDEFARILSAAELPALVYCRSGRRSAALWAVACAPLVGVDAVLDRVRPTQVGIEDLRPLLQVSAQRDKVPYANLADAAERARLTEQWVEGAGGS